MSASAEERTERGNTVPFWGGEIKITLKIKSEPDLSMASLKENKYLNLTIDYLLKLVVKVL